MHSVEVCIANNTWQQQQAHHSADAETLQHVLLTQASDPAKQRDMDLCIGKLTNRLLPFGTFKSYGTGRIRASVLG